MHYYKRCGLVSSEVSRLVLVGNRGGVLLLCTYQVTRVPVFTTSCHVWVMPAAIIVVFKCGL